MEPENSGGRIPTLIIIDSDNDNAIVTKECRKKVYRKKYKRQVTYDDKINEIKVTQEVHVKEQTTTKCVNYIQKKLERIVPTCGRRKCQAAVKNIQARNVNNKRCTTPLKKFSLQKQRKHKRHKDQSHNQNKSYKHCKEHNKSRMESKRDVDQLSELLSLSPISLSPLKSDIISYEDISLDSGTWCSETELDNLIVRSKERDRRLSEATRSSFKQSIRTSTPQDIIEISSDDETTKNIFIDKKFSINCISPILKEPKEETASSVIASVDSGFNAEHADEKAEPKIFNIQHCQDINKNQFLSSDPNANLKQFYPLSKCS